MLIDKPFAEGCPSRSMGRLVENQLIPGANLKAADTMGRKHPDPWPRG